MDFSKTKLLELMSSEMLIALRDKCVEVLAKRKAAALRRGAVGWFIDRAGDKRHIYVTRINAKTVSGYEVDPVTRKRINQTTWRVSPALLNITNDGVKPAMPAVPHRPTTSTSISSW